MPKSDADRIGELQAEVAQLREAVASHAVVDQAIGMVVALGRMTPEE
ncbi:ANTAR domain-containing protein [Streptomyces collinus]